MQELVALILAGGESERMGHDKALISYHGKPQLAYLHDLLRTVCAQVVISGQPRYTFGTQYLFLPDHPSLAHSGPIGGFLTAFTQFRAPMLVVGCDYPYFGAEAISFLTEQHQSDVHLVTAFRNPDGFIEPLLAIYSVEVLDMLVIWQQEGNQSIRLFLETIAGQYIAPPDPKWVLSVDK
jgi:molybdopterin-guanine dinucleotide biosynthesis protein A